MPPVERCVPRARVPLAPRTTLGVGGPARWLVEARSPADVQAAHAWSVARGVALFVLGGGSNIVVADRGIDGLVLHAGLCGMAFTSKGRDTIATVGAGEPWDRFVAAAVSHGLAGLECLSGIPGTVGGAPVQNVGAYGQDLSAVVDTVRVFDRRSGSLSALRAAECGFAYRQSRFKGPDAGRFIITEVVFRLREGPGTVAYPDVESELARAGTSRPTVADVRGAVLAVRRRKGMVLDPSDADTRSVGSFFLNPIVSDEDRDRISSAVGRPAPGFPAGHGRVKVPAAWLIERAGFPRGFSDGAVGLSTKHPLAIVNRGGAKASDVVRFACRIKRGVAERFGILLRPEPDFVGFGSDSELAYLVNAAS